MKEESPSLTAYVVCKGLRDVATTPVGESLVSAEAAELSDGFINACRGGNLIRGLIAFLHPKVSMAIADKVIAPGIPYHYAARKLAIEHTVRDAIKAGATQVVVASGGFDTLALRLHKEFPQVQFFETDHPATQNAKKKALQIMHKTYGGNLHFIHCDLSKTSLSEALHSMSAFDNTKKTVSVAEGLTMYLSQKEATTLFDNLHDIGGVGSQAVFGILGDTKFRGAEHGKTIEGRVLKNAGEGYKFSMMPSEIPEYIRQRGLHLNKWITYQELQKKVGAPEKRYEGAEDENYFLATKGNAREIPNIDINEIPKISFPVPSRGRSARSPD